MLEWPSVFVSGSDTPPEGLGKAVQLDSNSFASYNHPILSSTLANTKPMVINVAQLLKEPVGSMRVVDVSGEEELGVHGKVQLVRTDCSILVRGRLATEVETTCSRCAASITCPVTFEIEEEFFPSIDVVSGVPVPVPDDPDDPDAFTIDEGHILDMHEAVRQYALLALPIKRLCQAQCRGLCPECGHNLNEGQCSCARQAHDERWAKLGQLIAGIDSDSKNVESTERARRKLARR